MKINGYTVTRLGNTAAGENWAMVETPEGAAKVFCNIDLLLKFDSIDEARAYKKSWIKNKAGIDITAIAPIWKQVNTLRANPNSALFNSIDTIRAKSDKLELDVDAATTVEEVMSVQW